MKLLISMCLSITAGCFVRGLTLCMEGGRRPSGDFLTAALRRFVQDRLLPHNIPWLDRYVRHVTPMMQEISLPGNMDLPLFLGLHLLTASLVGAAAIYLFPDGIWVALPVAAAIGGSVPYFWLLQQRSRLHTMLLKAIPEWLELMSLVMEAGLDLSAGIQQYLQKGAPGPLQKMLGGVIKETQLGRSRSEALSSLAQKTSFGPLRDVCRSLVQGLSLGSSLAPLLREQGAALRTKRMQFAEKKAAEAPLKVLLPLFVFIVPTIFLVLFGPVAMLFYRGGF